MFLTTQIPQKYILLSTLLTNLPDTVHPDLAQIGIYMMVKYAEYNI